MPNKKRVEHYAKWNVARSASTEEFWKIIEHLFEKRGVHFSKEHLSVITHIDIDELGNDEISLNNRHHIFVTAQWAVRKSRSKEKTAEYKRDDPEGVAMSSLRCRHEEETGEVLPMLYWEKIVKKRFTLQEITGARHKIRRIDPCDGFLLENLEVVKLKKDT